MPFVNATDFQNRMYFSVLHPDCYTSENTLCNQLLSFKIQILIPIFLTCLLLADERNKLFLFF